MNISGSFTPKRFIQEQPQSIESPRGRLLIASCRAGTAILMIDNNLEETAAFYVAGRVLTVAQEIRTADEADG